MEAQISLNNMQNNHIIFIPSKDLLSNGKFVWSSAFSYSNKDMEGLWWHIIVNQFFHLFLISDLVLQNRLVLYDLENQTIGWTEYNCELFSIRKFSSTLDFYFLCFIQIYMTPSDWILLLVEDLLDLFSLD